MGNMGKIRFRPGLFVCLLLLLLTGTIWAEEGNVIEQIAIPEVKYTHFKLANGLEIYVFEDHQTPLAEVNLWYKVGSLDEPEGMTGISHFLEHLMFLGTNTLGKDQVHALVKRVGGRNNAFTSYYTTRYYEKVPGINLELAIAIEADRMGNLRIDPEEFRRERAVVQQERRRNIESDAIRSAWETIKAAAYTKSPLHHEVIGWMDDIGRLTPEKVMEYYQRYYTPNNAVLTVCGAVAPQKVYNLAQEYFGAYQPRTVKRSIMVEPKQKKEQRLTIAKVTEIPYLVMLYKLPAGNHPDMTAVRFLLKVLVDKRVKPELEHRRELILGAGYGVDQLPVAGYAQIVLAPIDADKITIAETAFDAELKGLIRHGVKDSEFQGVKKEYLKDLVFKQRNISNVAGMVIDGVVKYNDPGYYRRQINEGQSITKADLARIAKKYFVKSQRTVGYIVPSQTITDSSKTEVNPGDGKRRK
jgi:zinc protease